MTDALPDPLVCCVCGTTGARPWRSAPDNLLGGDARYSAVRCLRCGTARLDPRPPISEMRRFYAPGVYTRAEGPEGDAEVGRRLDALNVGLARRADAIAGGALPRRALDVGCGDGRFLAAMKRRGFTVQGLETDPVAADLARRRTGSVIHEASIETAGLPLQSFDLVSLLHVLEHLPDPRETLAAVRRALRPGGVLLLALPNAGSLEASLFGSTWYHLDLPRHLWGFTPHTLTRLVEESGFNLTSLRYFPLLFAPQSVRSAFRPKRGHVSSGGKRSGSSSGAGGGAWQTRLFLAMLDISERLGRSALPGEIMEMVAVRANTPVKDRGNE